MDCGLRNALVGDKPTFTSDCGSHGHRSCAVQRTVYDPPMGSLLVPFNEQLLLPMYAAPAATHVYDEDLADSMPDPFGDEGELSSRCSHSMLAL